MLSIIRAKAPLRWWQWYCFTPNQLDPIMITAAAIVMLHPSCFTTPVSCPDGHLRKQCPGAGFTVKTTKRGLFRQSPGSPYERERQEKKPSPVAGIFLLSQST